MADERKPKVMWRSIPVCDKCWEERNPDRQAIRLTAGNEEECMVCEELTTSGIFVRMRIEWA